MEQERSVQIGSVPMLLYAKRDYYGGFVVEINHNNNPDKIELIKKVMSEKPQPFILGDGVWWVRACSTPNLDTVRVEYELDTTRTDLHLWSYSVMLFIFRWYCCRAVDFFNGSVVGNVSWSYTCAGTQHGDPEYYSWALYAPVLV